MALSLMDANKIVAELKDHENYELLAFLFYLVGAAAELDMKTPLGALNMGQLSKSTRLMAEDFRLSKSTIHRRIRSLKAKGLIVTEGAGTNYRITVTNFSSYKRTEEGRPFLPEPPPEPKPKRPKKEVRFEEDSQEYKLADLLFRFIQIRIPSAKTPNLQTWAYDADLLFRVDNRNPEEAERVLRFSQKNAFWQRNILSIDKLRKHFDRLTMEMQNDNPDAPQSHPPLRTQSKSAADRRENRFREVVSKYS